VGKVRNVSDLQFKNQVIFTIKGMQANLEKIDKMFPITSGCENVTVDKTITHLHDLIRQIKQYNGEIIRRPK